MSIAAELCRPRWGLARSLSVVRSCLAGSREDSATLHLHKVSKIRKLTFLGLAFLEVRAGGAGGGTNVEALPTT